MTRMNMDAFFRAEDQEAVSTFQVFRAEDSVFRDFRQEEVLVRLDRLLVVAVDLGLQVVEEAPEDRMDRHQGLRQASRHRCSR